MVKKLILIGVLIVAVSMVAAACAQSPMIVYIVVTATPEGVIPSVSVEPTQAPTQLVPTTSSNDIATVEPTEAGQSSQVEAAPTNTVRQIYVAEQPFERGRMFWLEPTGQIWVMIETEPGFGLWQVYEDLFKEGDIEFDPTMATPEGLLQPVRGFGLIWRSNEEVREGLGWGTDIEVGFVTNYEYEPGGSVVDGVFQPGPGYHYLQNQYGQWFRFNEINGTWQSVQRTAPTPTPSNGTADS